MYQLLSSIRKSLTTPFKMPLTLCLYGLAVPHVALAQSEPAETNNNEKTENSSSSDQQPEPKNESLWIDYTKDYLGTTVNDFGTYIDQGLTTTEGEEVLPNRSYIRLRTMEEYSHLGGYVSDSSVSVRIDLPNTQRKWHLIFETDPNDQDSLESKERDLVSANQSAETNGAIGGVSVQDGLWSHWKARFDVGVKVKLPIDPFTRAELRRVENASDSWVVQFKQEVYYYHSIGAGLSSGLNFYHPVDEGISKIVTVGSNAQYLYDSHSWGLLSHVGLSDRINNNHLLEYSTGMSIDPGESRPLTNYWISFTWLQNIYKNWLYLSVVPKIDVPREYDYKINPGVFVRLEVFFSKNRDFDLLNRSIPKSTRRK